MYKDYYEKSLNELKKYIKDRKKIPSESKWNKYAETNKLLSSKSIQYGYGKEFHKMCKEILKEIKKQIN